MRSALPYRLARRLPDGVEARRLLAQRADGRPVAELQDDAGTQIRNRLRHLLKDVRRRVVRLRLRVKAERALQEKVGLGLRRRLFGERDVRRRHVPRLHLARLEGPDVLRRGRFHRLLRRDKLLPRRHRNRRNRAKHTQNQHDSLHFRFSLLSKFRSDLIL